MGTGAWWEPAFPLLVGDRRWASGRPGPPVPAMGEGAASLRSALGVLAGELRRGALLAVLLPVEPRLARPGALEVVADR